MRTSRLPSSPATRRAAATVFAALAAAACTRPWPVSPPNTYCQSGPKYGTQCYTSAGPGAGGAGQDPSRGRGESPNANLQPLPP